MPVDYFSTPQAAGSYSAMVTPFTHQIPPGTVGDALALYDISLRYYVLSLHATRSPYAFHSVGSTIAVSAGAYVAVRGMPKRQAAEDFYLLNKLAKIAPIFYLANQPIQLCYRPSVRVPFGTGSASEKISAQLEASEPFLLYHPQTFSRLGELLSLARSWQADENVESLRQRAPQPLTSLELDRDEPWSCFAAASKQKCSTERLRYNFHSVFDGFRTMRFIHQLRDESLASVPWLQALTPRIGPVGPGATVQTIQTKLIDLERQNLQGIPVGPTLAGRTPNDGKIADISDGPDGPDGPDV